MRLCQCCKRAIALHLRADAVFCSQDCRKAAYRLAIWAGNVRPAPSPELVVLRDALIANSEHFMVGYSLGLIDGLQRTRPPNYILPPNPPPADLSSPSRELLRPGCFPLPWQ